MPDSLTHEMFAPLVGQTLRLHLDDGATIETRLDSATARPPSGWQPQGSEPARPPFTLVFVGPAQFVLPQRIYRFTHDELGEVEIFIVPIGRNARGVTYEAVFS